MQAVGMNLWVKMMTENSMVEICRVLLIKWIIWKNLEWMFCNSTLFLYRHHAINMIYRITDI